MTTTQQTSIAPLSVNKDQRQFNGSLLSEIETNLDSLRTDDNQQIRTAISSLAEPTRKLIAEATTLGLPRVAKLGRAIVRCLESAAGRSEDAVADALLQAYDVLLVLSKKPDFYAGMPMNSIIGLLKGVFLLTDAELLSPMPLYCGVKNTTPTERTSPDTAFATHHDSSIYSSAVLDALDRCAEEESWTVAQLAALAEDLACETDRIRPAHRLMNVLRNHRYFRFVDRLCMAGLVHGSNQLTVVDSCVSQRLRTIRDENPMPRGYSCFVNPQGSLFQMRPGVLRVFDDTNRVIESYVRQGKPPQRSIAHIADTGLKSGLCLAIGRAERVQGFLFMNSLESDYFKDINSRFAPLLSLFSLLGTVTFDAAGFHAETGTNYLESQLPAHSIEFRAEEFATLIEQTMERRRGYGIKTNVIFDQSLRFLYLPRTVIQIVVELLDRFNRSNEMVDKTVEVQVRVQGEQVMLWWTHSTDQRVNNAHQFVRDSVESVRASFREVPVMIDAGVCDVEVRFPIEPIFEGVSISTYSVAY